MNIVRSLVFLSVLFIAAIMLMRDDVKSTSKIELKKDALVLAFGDSITYGYGLSPKDSYPSQLQKMTGLRVINAGIPGEESAEGLLRLQEYLEERPQLVILCHGGNDLLRQRSQEKLKKNLLAMIELIKNSGAKVLLVAVANFGLLGFKPHPLYAEAANESGVYFEEYILPKVESDNALKIDYVHPNAKGYKMMAEAFAEKIKLV